MSNNINRAVSLTSLLISLPPSRYLVLFMVLFGFLFGILAKLPSLDLNSVFISLTYGFLVFSLPSLLTAALIWLFIRTTPIRRILALSLCGQIIYAIAFLISLFVFSFDTFWAQAVLLFGSSVVFLLWYVIARFVFLLKYRSLLFAMLQLLLCLIFLFWTNSATVFGGTIFSTATKFYVSALVVLGSILLFFFIINAPMKKNLGVKSTDALSLFFSQWLYHNKDMEKTFEKVGEVAKTIVSVVGFKRQNDELLLVTPYVHFGPFGNLGGSEFSYLICDAISSRFGAKSLVFHGSVTHDLNPVSTSQMEIILDSIDSMRKGAKYSQADTSLSVGSFQEAKSYLLKIGNSSIVSVSRAPHTTEDINFGVGLSLINLAKKDFDSVMLVDQHNSETGEITSFEPGSIVGYNYQMAIEDSLKKAAQSKNCPLKVGYSESGILKSSSIGNAGIKVVSISSDPISVIILIDSNGVSPQFKDQLDRSAIDAAKSMNLSITPMLCTTDTHQLNNVRGVLNPLKEEGETLSLVSSLVKKSLGDMSPSTYFASSSWVDIKVIGAKQSIELISTVNSIVAISKFILPLILLASLLLLVTVATSI